MFLNPLMLAGLGGAMLPLVLHLLSRARYRSVDWGAMMFLDAGDSRQRQSARVRQWILLGLRMAIIAVLAMALARPVIRGAVGGLTNTGKTTAIIVVDASASMAFDESGRTRLDLAREAVLQILSGLGKGDQVCLIVMGESEPRRVSGGGRTISTDLQTIASRVSEMTATAAQADVAQAITSALGVFEQPEARETPNRELYVVCDRQAKSWEQATGAMATAWNERRRQTSGALRFVVIPVGGTSIENVAIESAELVNPPAIVNQAAEVQVRLHNLGLTARDAISLAIVGGNGADLASATVGLRPGETQIVTLAPKFTQIGSQTAAVQIKTAGVSTAPRFPFAMDVVATPSVLVISGEERPSPFRSESDFLRLALAPFQDPQNAAGNFASVKVMPVEQWTDLNLAAYRAVVLANVPQLSSTQLQAIEQYVYAGGGLWIAPGNLVQADEYNRALYRDGSGILPVAISPPTSADGSGATNILGLDLAHPVFRFLKGQPDPIPTAAIGRYFPTGAATNDARTRVLGSYVSGKPFLIEYTVGRGRVLWMSTPIDADWNALPLSNFYLPFVQSVIRYLAASGVESRNLKAGEAIIARVDGVIDPKAVKILRPGGRADSESAEVTRLGAVTEVRYADTTGPGEYAIAAGEKVMHFVVQPPDGEADLTPLSSTQWMNLQKSLGFEVIEAGAGSLAAVLRAPRIGSELWPGLLALAIVLGVVELAAARSFTVEQRGRVK